MKKIIKKLSVFLLGLFITLIVNAETIGEWKDSPNGFEYQSKGLSCKIDKKGNILNLKTPKIIILSHTQIYASPIKPVGEKLDIRIFQAKKCTSLKIKTDSSNNYSLIMKGELGNKKSNNIADYTTNITFTPTKISFDYEVVTKEPLNLKCYSTFFSLEYVPCSVLKSIGYVTIGRLGKKKLCQFPTTYTKNELHKKGIKILRIILPDGHVIFSTGEKTSISLLDTRAWGGKNFRIDVKPDYPYKAKPIEFPAGSKFQWSYSISFEKK